MVSGACILLIFFNSLTAFFGLKARHFSGNFVEQKLQLL